MSVCGGGPSASAGRWPLLLRGGLGQTPAEAPAHCHGHTRFLKTIKSQRCLLTGQITPLPRKGHSPSRQRGLTVWSHFVTFLPQGTVCPHSLESLSGALLALVSTAPSWSHGSPVGTLARPLRATRLKGCGRQAVPPQGFLSPRDTQIPRPHLFRRPGGNLVPAFQTDSRPAAACPGPAPRTRPAEPWPGGRAPRRSPERPPRHSPPRWACTPYARLRLITKICV